LILFERWSGSFQPNNKTDLRNYTLQKILYFYPKNKIKKSFAEKKFLFVILIHFIKQNNAKMCKNFINFLSFEKRVKTFAICNQQKSQTKKHGFLFRMFQILNLTLQGLALLNKQIIITKASQCCCWALVTINVQK